MGGIKRGAVNASHYLSTGIDMAAVMTMNSTCHSFLCSSKMNKVSDLPLLKAALCVKSNVARVSKHVYSVLLILCCLHKLRYMLYLIFLACAQALLLPSLTRYRIHCEKVNFTSSSASETECWPGGKMCCSALRRDFFLT